MSTLLKPEDLKVRNKTIWVAGDFGRIAVSLERAGEEFITRRNIAPATRVLDVACGTGNLAIPAAKAAAIVTGVDIAPNLLEQGRERARRVGVEVTFDEGDAEALPYRDGAFDLVVSMFGAMFALNPDRAAAELIRVCRSGGEIAMANWTPGGFVGKMFKLVASHVPPPPGTVPPTLWGVEETVRERFGDAVTDPQATPVIAWIKYPFSPAETVEHFRRYFGPQREAYAALPPDKQEDLRRDLEAHWTEHNQATDGTTQVAAEYLEIVAKRA